MVYLRRRPLSFLSVVHANIRCACPCAMLFDSPPFTGGPLRQAYLCSQPKLQKGREPCSCCGHSAVLWPRLYLCSQPKLEKGRAWLLLLPQRCTVAAAVVSHERFRTITLTIAVLRWRPRDTRSAHLHLVPDSSASLAPNSRSRAAVMWPQLLWMRTKEMLRWWMTVPLNSSSSLIICHLDRLIS